MTDVLCYFHGMKLFSLNETPFAPVSHDPGLKKQVLMGGDVLPGLRHISHINLLEGSRAVEHDHPDAYEVFYCMGGKVLFKVGGREVPLSSGQLLIVEPGERHSIEDTPEEAELLYFMSMKA